MAKSDDYLAALPETQVAAWYGRLAALIGKEKVRGNEPLAAIFLKHYLANRDKTSTFKFDAPLYLREYPDVGAVLEYHRAVFLTNKKARIGKSEKWAGIIPRLKDGRWRKAKGPLSMHYESLVEVGGSVAEIARIQLSGTPVEKDIFASLRGFQLRSEVVFHGKSLLHGKYEVKPVVWTARVKDRYDFNFKEHLTLPNPDFGSKEPDAVRPTDRKLRVYHSNAERLEKAGLAAPYDLESKPWAVSDPALLSAAVVDPGATP